MGPLRVQVKEKDLSYAIQIGWGAKDGIGDVLRDLEIARHCVVITDEHLSALHVAGVIDALSRSVVRTDVLVIPAGEAVKNMDTVLSLTDQLLRIGADRTSTLAALGGGVVGDLVGFLASLYMRSLPYIQIPTTLVAQVDSSVGGKTAVDIRGGKNILGTFYQPRAVVIDPQFLFTLPEVEFRNGLAEVIKYGVIDRGGFFAVLEGQMQQLRERREETLLQVIETSMAIKAHLVEIDEKDQGPRHFLNFGHTVGHALEAASGYTLSHGNAVAMGMVVAARLSEKISGLTLADRMGIENLIDRAGLPTSVPPSVSTEDLISLLQRDKKKSGSEMKFVLIHRIGEPFVSSDVTASMVRETIEELKR